MPTPPPTDIQHLKDCATSCARTMETRKIQSHEVPLVLGSIIAGLSRHTGVPVKQICEMTLKAAETFQS